MRKVPLSLVALWLAASCAWAAERQWVPVKSQPPQSDLRFVEARDAGVWFAGSDSAVYRTKDGGESWSAVLSLKGSNRKIYDLLSDSSEPDTIYACTSRGIRRSTDGGKRWSAFFKPPGTDDQDVFSLAPDASDPTHRLWAGTANGLYAINKSDASGYRVDSLPAKKVYSILSPTPAELVARTEKGVFRRIQDRWEQVTFDVRPEAPAEAGSLQQFQIEEIAAGPPLFNVVYSKNSDAYLTAMSDGLYSSSDEGWKRLDGADLRAEKIRRFASAGDAIYAATDRGIFRWDEDAKKLETFSDGLQSTDVRWVSYSDEGDFLLAATSSGVYRLPHPDLRIDAFGENPVNSYDILGRFDSEPSIAAVQLAAVRYAEVHPDKIAGWRAAAARKALMPTLSVDADLNTDRNVDVDRGGTGDPDRFIIGPEERSVNWTVGLNWNLGDLIWNDDQTSIDTRSKLMVELRQDILNEVTHLYFERRRLQTDILMSPPRDLPVRIEKELRLQELTAQLDALTGGFLSNGGSSDEQAAHDRR